mmetsp:Transcript_106217/g.188109  ORF Transcript_106217/g.188109 Transcript_106217/m.188109 type:complete len:243 (+) Transcript_106217:2-730(+)
MMQKLIERNSTIPTNKSQDFTTSEDYQDHVDISVYEGERAMVKDNNFLGTFKLTGLPSALRGVPKIRVTFNIDSNGILEVTALDTKTNNKSDIQITNEKGRLSQDQIEKMLEDADKNKEEDDLARGEQAIREVLVAYVAKSKEALNEFTNKISGKDKERLQKMLDEAETWLAQAGQKANRQDLEAVKKDLENGMNAIMLRTTRQQKDFWEEEVEVEKDQRLENGGWLTGSGLDLRSLIEPHE